MLPSPVGYQREFLISQPTEEDALIPGEDSPATAARRTKSDEIILTKSSSIDATVDFATFQKEKAIRRCVKGNNRLLGKTYGNEVDATLDSDGRFWTSRPAMTSDDSNAVRRPSRMASNPADSHIPKRIQLPDCVNRKRFQTGPHVGISSAEKW